MRYLDAEYEAAPASLKWDRYTVGLWPDAVAAVAAVDHLPPAAALAALEAHPLHTKSRHFILSIAIRNASDATPAGLEILRSRAASFAADAGLPQQHRYAIGTERDLVTADTVRSAYADLAAAEQRAGVLVEVAA